MLEVCFYDLNEVDDSLLKFAVIASRCQGKWVYCKHKERTTWEIPGGHREQDEAIFETAKRELFEETGATAFNIQPICVYCVKTETESFGLLYYADISALTPLPETEIETIALFDDQPSQLTYPEIQPKLFERATQFILPH